MLILKQIFTKPKYKFTMSTTSDLQYYTKEGLDKLRAELKELETKERPSISQQIAEARDKGDLSENAEYDAAKEAQGMLEMRIAKLQATIRNARILDESKIDTDKILLLSKVRIKNKKNNAEMNYVLVPENEADIKKGKISINSPIAKGLLGKKVGDTAEINVPAGMIPFEILEISR
jgi:transcription elongation factor GreA